MFGTQSTDRSYRLVVGLFIAWAVSQRQAARKGSDLSRNYFRGLNYLLNEEPDKAIEVFI
jgi:lipopolysaccharide biosynthesis regulator YciM